MLTWMIWTESPVTEAALRKFAEAESGYWNDTVGDEAIIERGEARVFISAAPTSDETNVFPDDVAFATSTLGRTPATVLWITVGHASGSLPLAEEVAAHAINLWGGFLDRNSGQ